MNIENLDKWHKRPYGWRAEGFVETDNDKIKVTVRRPGKDVPESGKAYVLANGWTAGKNSMRIPAIQAARFGHRATTLEYSNTGTAAALRGNVRDVAAVIDAQPEDLKRAAMGLSMGGAVVTMAMLEARSRIEVATLVASGKYINAEHYSKLRILRRFIAEAGEIAQVGRNPVQAAYLGMTSAGNCARRPWAVGAELTELLEGTVHGELRTVKAMQDAPYVRFAFGLGDKLLPAFAQASSVEGLPFDEVLPYEGGHARLAYDPTLSAQFFEKDARLPDFSSYTGGLVLAA
jgi:pimeloyl-ACP methyl ester carboxylesterase